MHLSFREQGNMFAPKIGPSYG